MTKISIPYCTCQMMLDDHGANRTKSPFLKYSMHNGCDFVYIVARRDLDSFLSDPWMGPSWNQVASIADSLFQWFMN